MAGFTEFMTRSNTDGGAGRAMKEVAKRLIELEETEDRTASAVEDVKKLQRGLSAKIDELEKAIEAKGVSADAGAVPDLSEVDKETAKKIGDLRDDLADVKAQMNALNDRIEAMSEDFNEGMDENNRRLESLITEIKEKEQATDEEDSADFEEKLEVLKLSLEDTIHKENIKCFRNIQGALEEESDGKNYDVSGLKKYVRVTIWFQLVTIAIVVLHILGMI